MLLTVSELRLLIKEKLDHDPLGTRDYSYFHLSKNDLGHEFTFTPRTPRAPMWDDDGMIIEDDFTPRISWAPSISQALMALDQAGTMYVYGRRGVQLPGEIDVEKTSGKFPTSPQNQYGPDFKQKPWKNWIKKMELPTELTVPPPGALAPRAFKNSVPDAEETKEVWATKPTKARRLGTIEAPWPPTGQYKVISVDK